MRGVANINVKLSGIGISLAAVLSLLAGSSVAAQSMVGAVVCEATSTITISSPESDSIVTQPNLTIEGEVAQASQIEVEVDGVFDSIIPLTVGQTSYSGVVHLSVGTHTVKATAVSLCPGANGSASVVVTHERAVTAPSTGGNVDTSVDSSDSSDAGGSGVSDNENLGFFGALLAPLQPLGMWLNIGDYQESDVSLMPIGRAFLFTAGLYLAIIGLTQSFLKRLAANSFVTSFFSSKMRTKKKLPYRIRTLSWLIRIVGILIIIGSVAFL
jgi:hypothetical protein